jgi:hypothetical protein
LLNGARHGAQPDVDGRRLILSDRALSYDHLVIATGAAHSYFGHDDWAPRAPGLKTVEDALEIRRRILYAYEAAERELDPERQRAWLTLSSSPSERHRRRATPCSNPAPLTSAPAAQSGAALGMALATRPCPEAAWPRLGPPQPRPKAALPPPALGAAARERKMRYLDDMSALKARVENGRLKLDEPTDLPEGTVVPLEISEDWDDLDDEERDALHKAIREGFEDAKAGRTISAEQWAAELRARL